MMNLKLKKAGTMVLTLAMIGATSISVMAAEKIEVSPAKVIQLEKIDLKESGMKAIPLEKIDLKESGMKAIPLEKLKDGTYNYELEDGDKVTFELHKAIKVTPIDNNIVVSFKTK